METKFNGNSMSYRCLLDTFKSGTSGYQILKAIWEVWVMKTSTTA